jgi:hypothetical protein
MMLGEGMLMLVRCDDAMVTFQGKLMQCQCFNVLVGQKFKKVRLPSWRMSEQLLASSGTSAADFSLTSGLHWQLGWSLASGPTLASWTGLNSRPTSLHLQNISRQCPTEMTCQSPIKFT